MSKEGILIDRGVLFKKVDFQGVLTREEGLIELLW